MPITDNFEPHHSSFQDVAKKHRCPAVVWYHFGLVENAIQCCDFEPCPSSWNLWAKSTSCTLFLVHKLLFLHQQFRLSHPSYMIHQNRRKILQLQWETPVQWKVNQDCCLDAIYLQIQCWRACRAAEPAQ